MPLARVRSGDDQAPLCDWEIDHAYDKQLGTDRKVMIVAVCKVSRYTVVHKVAGTGMEEAGAFVEQLVSYYPGTRSISSDRAFLAADFLVKLEEAGVTHHASLAGRSAGHGLVERTVQAIRGVLHHYGEDWWKHITEGARAINGNINGSTGFSPEEVAFGVKRAHPLAAPPTAEEELRGTEEERHNAIRAVASQAAAAARAATADTADKIRRAVPQAFKVGQSVQRTRLGTHGKMQAALEGAFRITSVQLDRKGYGVRLIGPDGALMGEEFTLPQEQLAPLDLSRANPAKLAREYMGKSMASKAFIQKIRAHREMAVDLTRTRGLPRGALEFRVEWDEGPPTWEPCLLNHCV